MSHIEVQNVVPKLYTEIFEERISHKKIHEKGKHFHTIGILLLSYKIQKLKYYTNNGTEHLSTLCVKPAKFVNVRAGGNSSNHSALNV